MHIKNIINSSIDEHKKTIDLISTTQLDSIASIGVFLANSLLNGGALFWCGNGGSASDSQHLAAELIGRFNKNRRALRSIALNSDTSVLSCIANDYSYEDIFSRQLEGLGKPGDVLIGISTSGNSENVIRALQKAKMLGIASVALLGNGGGKAVNLAEHSIIVPSLTTARIQEIHILIGHILCEIIERELKLD
jgi:D-sedoheptulose 7-phosphate isomerase